jgi:hypothetical protein
MSNNVLRYGKHGFLLQLSYCPKLETMRQEGCKDGCFWTTVSSDTCEKAILSICTGIIIGPALVILHVSIFNSVGLSMSRNKLSQFFLF